ncbi:MAG: endonuclease/exonuclease/phosphatase family protein [Clostridia bacterium]|nr:endonuclease/exonuclease/phosphatase family protein [Clostridia bacterium]
MKREDVFQYLKQSGHDHVVKADASDIRVMTSNVLFSTAQNSQDFELPYEERADILAAQYLYFQPDFLGLQEVTRQMKETLAERLSEVYAFVETPTRDLPPTEGAKYYDNCTPLLYRKDRYEVLQSRYHLFGRSDFFSYHWAMYADKQDLAKRYIHMNLHFYPVAGEKQLQGGIDAHAELVHLRRHYPTVPIFVTGDYNCHHHSEPFRVMVDGLDMESGMLVAEDIEENGTDYWCHLVGSTELQTCGTAIDHVAVTTDLVNVKVHRVLFDELLCKSSDHCARFLDVEVKKSHE